MTSPKAKEIQKLIQRAEDTPDRALQQSVLLKAIAIGVLELLLWKEAE